MDVVEVTSRATQWTLAPVVASSLASACKRSTRRAASTTVAPALAKDVANCTPKPLEAPVMNATLPVKSI